MAMHCTWKVCELEEKNKADGALVVQFANGNLKNADGIDFAIYKHKDSTNPRKKNRRVVVAETDRMSYVGNNFEKESLKCNSLCNYYVGVLNKETNVMEVHRAQLFNMQPVIPEEAAVQEEDGNGASASYREKLDSLIEAFGTNKQKRALSSKRMNEVGSETLQQAVAKVASDIIQHKGAEALEQDVANMEAEHADFLPYFNADADKPEDVYPFDKIISPGEYDALEASGRKLAELSAEDLQKMVEGGSPKTVLAHLQNLENEGKARDRQARCAFYLSQMINLCKQKNVSSKFGEEDECPRIVQNKLFRTFTVETFRNQRLQNSVPASMRVKVAAYCLALLLHMGHQSANLTLLHHDLGMSENKIVELAKVMGLKVNKQTTLASEKHKIAVLALPLVKYKKEGPRKRKKIH